MKSTVHCRAHEARTPPLDLSSVQIPTQDTSNAQSHTGTRGVSSLQVSRSTLCAHLILPQCKSSPVRRAKHLERSDGLSMRSLHSASLITLQWPRTGMILFCTRSPTARPPCLASEPSGGTWVAVRLVR